MFLTFCVIFATLVFQGLTLPWLVQWLGLGDDGLNAREEAAALLRASEAALAAIAQKMDAANATSQPGLEELRVIYQHQHHEASRLVAVSTDLPTETVTALPGATLGEFPSLRREMLRIERAALLATRREGKIHDNVLHRLEHELDLEEQRTRRR